MAKPPIDHKKVNKVLLIAVVSFYALFIIYLLSSRKPNYFTSEKTVGKVVGISQQQMVSNGTLYIKKMPVIHFKSATDSVEFIYSDDEYLNSFHPGDEVSVVYKGEDVGQAAILAFIGYWITLNELMASLVACAIIAALIKAFYSPPLKS